MPPGPRRGNYKNSLKFKVEQRHLAKMLNNKNIFLNPEIKPSFLWKGLGIGEKLKASKTQV